jgi:hypothetical protein
LIGDRSVRILRSLATVEAFPLAGEEEDGRRKGRGSRCTTLGCFALDAEQELISEDSRDLSGIV